MFDRCRSNRLEGRAKWNIDDVCRWSYFFIDTSLEKLVALSRHLEQQDYELAGFLEPAPEDDDQETIYLRVDRLEKHTVDTLLARNDEFYALARKFKVADYDGMDVGAVEGP